ncbi:MAG: hypothetical protein BGO72_21460 [Burkholderiales bacterium 70-64]|nr:MAG: hypothetical protein BGO72_21460 [Burkholderiales bacterium 70-64]
MKAILGALLAAVALAVQAQVTPAQLTAYVTQLGNLAIAQDAQIRALQARVAELETREAKNRENISHIIAHADVMVRYAVGLECWFNKNVPSILTAFSWVKPFELGAIACPPEDQRYYLPYYLSPDGPVLPPAQ